MKTFRCARTFFAIGILLILPNCSRSEYSPYRTSDARAGNVNAEREVSGGTLLDSIDNLANKYVGNRTVPGSNGAPQLPSLVLGVVTPEFSKTLTYGTKVNGQQPTDLDIYPISSIAKMFTGLITAKGVVNKDFSENTPVGDLLKTDISPLVGNLTLGQLLTHRAGLIGNPKNLHYKESPNSPGKNYSRRELIACLKDNRCSLASSREGGYLYSNLGVGLLGVALEDYYHKPYEKLLSENFGRSLGMTDTHTRAFVTDESRIVEGLTKNGTEVPPATMGVLAGAGEILSTGRDMLILLNTMLNPPDQWAETVRIATTPLSSDQHKIAYTIEIRDIQSMILLGKGGDQAGYSSLIMWSPELQSGAFALTNRGMSSKTLAFLLRSVLKEIKMRSSSGGAGVTDERGAERSTYRRRY